MLTRGVALLFVTIYLFSSCRTKPTEAVVASYIYIPEFEIDNSQNTSGIDIFSHNIKDVWVYLDNDNQGAYELPALIPIAASGKHRIELRPGIFNAGITIQRRPFPYYTEYVLEDYNLISGVVDTIKPVTYYLNSITVVWEEQFEDPQPNYILNPDSDTGITFTGDDYKPELVFRGNHSAEVIMEEPGILFEIYTETLNNLQSETSPIYLELNYKSNYDFTVGFYRNNKSEQFPIYVVKEQEDWHKIYLDFTEPIIASTPGSNFNIFIGFLRRQDIPRVEMYLDNIKLIHD